MICSVSLESLFIVQVGMEAHYYDGLVTIPGCDKNMPGCVMGMLRVNRPSLMLYGGSIASGKSSKGETLDIVSTFEAYGKFVAGTISSFHTLQY